MSSLVSPCLSSLHTEKRVSPQACHKFKINEAKYSTKIMKRTFSVKCQASNNDAKESVLRELGIRAVSVMASTLCILGGIPGDIALADDGFVTYYGTAASASSYGGYGGNSSKKDSAEYTYDVPELWKERNISKVEKGTNGTDSEFFNPKKRTEKTYVTFLAGFRRLPPIDVVLNNLALSDVNLQDVIASADEIIQSERVLDGQKFYDFDIDSPLGRSLISVTCVRNKLYAHFVNVPSNDWSRDEALARHIHDSFTTTIES